MPLNRVEGHPLLDTDQADARQRGPRYTLASVLAATGLSIPHLAEHVGVERTSVYRWQREGMTFEAFETVCERLRVVPYEVEPEWLAESAERARAVVEAEDLAESIRAERAAAAKARWARERRVRDAEWRAEQNARRKAYYDATAPEVKAAMVRINRPRNTAWKREKYRSDPAYREREKAKRRAWYAANRERQQAKQIAYYYANQEREVARARERRAAR